MSQNCAVAHWLNKPFHAVELNGMMWREATPPFISARLCTAF